MDSEYILRPMRPEDWKAFEKMEGDIFIEDRTRKDQFISSISTRTFLALEKDGELVGELLLSRFGNDEAHLNRIGVAQSYQSKGLGSLLMNHALEWFRKQGNISTVHLYTQDYNSTAQSLYKKFGFRITGTTWHYFIPFASLRPEGKYTCHEILENEIECVGNEFPSLPAAQIRNWLNDKNTKYYVLTLKDKDGFLLGAARYTPSFPGSFPFEITRNDCFDDFIAGMEKRSYQGFNYVRTVFTDNPELAKFCEEREYNLHHKLFKMSLNL